MNKRVRLIVSGRVQGVFFRAYTHEFASSLGVTGFVRNLWDGTVEIVAEGEAAQLEELIRWARVGPPSARVQNLDVAYEEPTDEFTNFGVSY